MSSREPTCLVRNAHHFGATKWRAGDLVLCDWHWHGSRGLANVGRRDFFNSWDINTKDRRAIEAAPL